MLSICLITFHLPSSNFRRYKIGTTIIPETNTSGQQRVHIIHDEVPNELSSPAGTLRSKWVFLTAIGWSKEEVYDAFSEGI